MRRFVSTVVNGRVEVHEVSKALLARVDIPSELKIVRLDPQSPVSLVAATVALCQSCGLSTMPGGIMRGEVLPGLCLVAVDKAGIPLPTASSYSMHASPSPRADVAFWGALATRPDARGRGLAVLLGAMATKAIWEEHGTRGFSTGIKEDNLAPQGACAKLVVLETDMMTAFCFDEAVMRD